LILKKISKIGATRRQILRLKCTKIDFGWDSAPNPLAVFKGPTSKGKEGEGEERREREGEGKGKGRGRGEGQGKGVQGRGERPYPVANSWLGHCT